MRFSWLIALAALGSSSAFAEINNAEADRLFKEAIRLREVNIEQACKKFSESLSFNPQAIGTRLNVALCDERLGKIASAVEKFSEVSDRAREQKLDEYQKVADEHLATLRPKVPYLTLELAEPAADLKIVVDDRVVTRAQIAKLPIDPGERTIVVSAPGRVSHVEKVVIGVAQQSTVKIPVLKRSSGSRTTVAKLTVISGGVMFASSVALALVARSRFNDAISRCTMAGDGYACADPADVSAADSAKTLGTVATVIGAVGLVATAAGGVLWWRAGRKERTGVAYVGPTADAGLIGLAAAGRF